MAYQGNPGMSKLGNTISKRIARQTDSPLILDYGSIEPDYSLKTNTFPVPIPKSDYTVCRHVGGLSFSISGGGHSGHEAQTQTHNTGGHMHTVAPPKIKPGDRVLVAWIQNEATVIDVIVPASSL